MQFPKGVFSIPNLLCYFRVAYLPVMVLLFHLDYVGRAEHTTWPAWTNVALYTLAGLTDFLDGIIARWLKQETLLGKFLDSSTDKLVVSVSLICLVAYQQLQGIWMVMVIIIVSREILIAGVREFMALYNVVVKISWIGKWKLTIQMLFIGFLIAGEYGEDLVPHAVVIGRAGFVLATAMTIWSGWDYMREAWKTIQRLEAEGKV
ncbi:MAG: CDP-diacylglycerol--glycerol-3-phosphate 3-phosphatidyltransferase [Alphaproteobacteria bacterium]|nr:MAG: CDP-diacylglycerol--glycerol-3-phosphate 3-phosphatidyltransferase [Alphaproteobacteria bacterium]